MEGSKRGLIKWWFQDAVGARRCLATGLMPPSVCMMDRETDSLIWTRSTENTGSAFSKRDAAQPQRVYQQGRRELVVTVQEQVAHALRVKEQAEQSSRVSMAFMDGGHRQVG